MRAQAVLPALLSISCAAPAASFRPSAESGAGREGEPAAAYEVRDDSGRVAEVNVWSQGTYLADDGGAYAHVAIEIKNVGTGSVTLDSTAAQLEVFDSAGVPLSPTRLVSVFPAGAERRRVAPATAADIDLLYALGPIAPATVGSMRLRWILIEPDSRQYVQFTDFTRDDSRAQGTAYAYVPIFGFYDPFFVWNPFFVWTGPGAYAIRPHHVHVHHTVVVPSRRWHR